MFLLQSFLSLCWCLSLIPAHLSYIPLARCTHIHTCTHSLIHSFARSLACSLRPSLSLPHSLAHSLTPVLSTIETDLLVARQGTHNVPRAKSVNAPRLHGMFEEVRLRLRDQFDEFASEGIEFQSALQAICGVTCLSSSLASDESPRLLQDREQTQQLVQPIVPLPV